VRLAQIAFAGRADAHLRARGRGGNACRHRGIRTADAACGAARVAGGLSNRIFQVAVTNVPGPQHPLYAGATELAEIYRSCRLRAGRRSPSASQSYNGWGSTSGINADHDALPDLDEFAQLIEESLDELVAANETAHSAAGAGSRRRAATRLAAAAEPRCGRQGKPGRVRPPASRGNVITAGPTRPRRRSSSVVVAYWAMPG